jgi:hypothetical protein
VCPKRRTETNIFSNLTKERIIIMKRFICVLMVLLLTISATSFTVSASNEVSVLLDGELLEFDVPPQIINGRTMVPMRKIFESLGATVEWEGNTRTITAQKENITIVMQIDNNVILVNENSITLDVPPQLVDERTLVPVRAVAESFNINTLWDGTTSTVLLSTLIPFDSSVQAFNHLFNWLIEKGKVYGEYMYVGWQVDEDVFVEIRCYPESGNIGFYLVSFDKDKSMTQTAINLRHTYDGKDVFASYISGTNTCRILGYINMNMHTNNYPLSYEECTPGEFETVYNLLEATRTRINYLLNETAILLSHKGTGVSLNTLGFKKY